MGERKSPSADLRKNSAMMSMEIVKEYSQGISKPKDCGCSIY